jgi:nucleotide-binding universal stress UspA family protein
MSYKDLLVILDAAPDTPGRIELAVGLAARFAAHLVGLYPVPSPELPRAAGYADLAALEPIYRDWRERALAQAEETRTAFEAAAQQHGVAVEWRAPGDGDDADPALHARYADLAILGQRNPAGDDAALRGRGPSMSR